MVRNWLTKDWKLLFLATRGIRPNLLKEVNLSKYYYKSSILCMLYLSILYHLFVWNMFFLFIDLNLGIECNNFSKF